MSSFAVQLRKAAGRGKPKKILRKLRVDEISGVDRAAQEPAYVRLMKREFSAGEREKLAEKGAAMPDGSFPIKSTGDLQNAIKAYGRAKDKTAAAAHIKRRARALGATDLLPEEGALALKKRAMLTTSNEGHSHLVELEWPPWNGAPQGSERTSGTTSYSMSEDAEREHSHPWVMDSEGNVTIGEADGHTHEISVISKGISSRAELEQVLKDLDPTSEDGDVVLAFARRQAEELGEDFGEVAKAAGMKMEMEDDEDPEEEEMHMSGTKKTLTDSERIEALEKRLERSEKVNALSAVEKAHFDVLKDDAARDAFLAKDAKGREEEVKKVAAPAKAEGTPTVVYKSLSGVEYTDKHDPAVVALAKQNDDLAAKLAKSETERELDQLRKRAETELGHLPGTVEARTHLLKAIDAIPDATARQSALEAVKAGDNALAKAFETLGSGAGAGGTEAGSAEEKLEKLAKAHQEKNPTLSEAAAYDAVLKTAEGAKLYAQAVEEHDRRR